MSSEPIDRIAASLDAPMIVVTAAVDDERAGCLVGFHAQSSIDPVRWCVWLSKANHTFRVARDATHLGMHFLTAADHELATLFGGRTGDDVDKLARCHWEPGPGGVPMLTACPNRAVVRRVVMLDEGGDHVAFTVEPVEVVGDGAFTPLRQSDVTDVEPGHPAGDRPTPPTERAG